MRVDPTHWGPHSCDGLLCDCCDGVVYESNLLYYYRLVSHMSESPVHLKKKKKKKKDNYGRFFF
jgi:hypothetical protein